MLHMQYKLVRKLNELGCGRGRQRSQELPRGAVAGKRWAILLKPEPGYFRHNFISHLLVDLFQTRFGTVAAGRREHVGRSSSSR